MNSIPPETAAKIETLAQDATKAIRGGRSTQQAYDAIFELTAELQAPTALLELVDTLQPKDALAAQFLLRTLRSIFARAAWSDSEERMLFGFPCLLGASQESSAVLTRIGEELEGWLTLNYGPGAQVRSSDTPVRVEDAASLFLENYAGVSLNLAAESACVWPITVIAERRWVSRMEGFLLTPRAATQSFLALRHRMEQLAEEGGMQFQLFPPASWANVFSLARFAHLRTALRQEVKDQPNRHAWNFLFENRTLTCADDDQGRKAWGVFPEETWEDIQLVLTSAARAHNVSLVLKPSGP